MAFITAWLQIGPLFDASVSYYLGASGGGSSGRAASKFAQEALFASRVSAANPHRQALLWKPAVMDFSRPKDAAVIRGEEERCKERSMDIHARVKGKPSSSSSSSSVAAPALTPTAYVADAWDMDKADQDVACDLEVGECLHSSLGGYRLCCVKATSMSCASIMQPCCP